MTGIFFYFIVAFIFVFSSVVKAGKKADATKNHSSRTTRTASSRPAANKVKNTASRARKNGLDYDPEVLSYCESTLSPGRGISFHNLKPGTDELALLVKRNNMRERELERAIQTGDHTH